MNNYAPGDSYYKQFCTASPYTSEAVDADSLPVATVNKNGVDDGASPTGWSNTLTVTKVATGRYIISGTVPSEYAEGDRVEVSVAATVAGLATVRSIDSFKVGVFEGELHEFKARWRNKREQDIATGVITIYDDDGVTPLWTETPSEADGTLTITPAGPE